MELATKSDPPDAAALYDRAIGWLAHREQCRAELARKLATIGGTDAQITPLLIQLEQQGYLSDARFSASWLRSRIQRGDTPTLAAHKARQKGVDEEALQQALAACHFDAVAASSRLLHKRDPYGFRFKDNKIWQRQIRYLASKGFAPQVILQVMQAKEREE
ncbi:MAG: regulatory protein RecX [Mariprofundales bacterium]|nr:regulatory protein RecX [Mariprofundales bacterium]